MAAVLRVALVGVLLPIGMLAAFFVCYAALYPSYWVNDLSTALKAFQGGILLLALSMGAVLWTKTRFERHLLLVSLLLVIGVGVLAFLLPGIFESLGRF